jgi:hypothetical protein
VKTKPFFVLFFAVVLGLGALSLYMYLTIEKADKAVATLVSPDRKFKAVRITLSGGAPKPFCFDSVSVMLTVYPDEFAERNKAYEVFSGPCDVPDKRAASPKIEWLSNTALQIAYSAKAPGFNESKAVKKHLDITKSVKVTFEARD